MTLHQQLLAAISVADDFQPSDDMGRVIDCVAAGLDTFHDNEEALRLSILASMSFLRPDIVEPDADSLIDDVEIIVRSI